MGRGPSWAEEPLGVGLRMTFHTDRFRSWLEGDTLEWFWSMLEQRGIPVATHAGHGDERHWVNGRFADIARRHPGLRFLIDHMNRRHLRGTEAWSDVDELLELAPLPNVAVKATCAPEYSAEPYPFADLHEPLRRIYDSFGPDRILRGSDLTRLTVPYAQCVALFSEALDFLSATDRELILSGNTARLLGWAEVP
jgi:predicted TIM-barrel fold metal-dependent hydrolase